MCPPNKFEVGQIVYFQPTINPRAWGCRSLISAPIKRVGTKWVTLESPLADMRFDPYTLRMDGKEYASPGRIWPTEAAYLEFIATNEAWSELRERVRPMRPPDNISRDQIEKALEVLFGPPERREPRERTG